jgi:hypothetical protein
MSEKPMSSDMISTMFGASAARALLVARLRLATMTAVVRTEVNNFCGVIGFPCLSFFPYRGKITPPCYGSGQEIHRKAPQPTFSFFTVGVSELFLIALPSSVGTLTLAVEPTGVAG